jgi:hypothetical protein
MHYYLLAQCLIDHSSLLLYRRTSNRTASATVGTKRTAPPTGPHIAETAEQDCKKICNPDLNKPFTNLEDAIDRLLPYHVRFFLFLSLLFFDVLSSPLAALLSLFFNLAQPI